MAEGEGRRGGERKGGSLASVIMLLLSIVACGAITCRYQGIMQHMCIYTVHVHVHIYTVLFVRGETP